MNVRLKVSIITADKQFFRMGSIMPLEAVPKPFHKRSYIEKVANSVATEPSPGWTKREDPIEDFIKPTPSLNPTLEDTNKEKAFREMIRRTPRRG